MEINTLPGLNPAISDICIMADAESLSYNTLITEILYLAAERFGLPFHNFKWDFTSKTRSLVPVEAKRNGSVVSNKKSY